MAGLYFRIIEKVDPAVFDGGWNEVVANRFVLDRTVWRSRGVSRSGDSCPVLRYDRDDGVWELKNQAPGRVVILHDGHQRYDLRRGMAMTLWPGVWRGTLTEAFSFELSVPAPVGPADGPDGPDGPDDGDETWTRTPVARAQHYLGVHWQKRFGLAYFWRQHLEHTTDSARDLESATVGRAFRVSGSTVTGWREELAHHVFRQRGHQNVIRDFVVDNGVLTRADVRDAVRYLDMQHHTEPDDGP